MNHHSSSGSNRCRRKYGMMVFLVFGAAIFGATILHQFRERRIFSILVKEKDHQLFALRLLLQREKDLNKDADKEIQELKDKVYALSFKKIDLDRRLLEMQSTISSLKDEHKVLESSLKDKEDEIKMLGQRDTNYSSTQLPQVSFSAGVLTRAYDDQQDKTFTVLSASTGDPAHPSVNPTRTMDVVSTQAGDDRNPDERFGKSMDSAGDEGDSGGEYLGNQEGRGGKLDGEVADGEGLERTTVSEKDLGPLVKRKHSKSSSKDKGKKWREFLRSRRSTHDRNLVRTGDSFQSRKDLSHDGGFKTGTNQYKVIVNAESKPKDEADVVFQSRQSNAQSNEMHSNNGDTRRESGEDEGIKSQDNRNPENVTNHRTTIATQELQGQPKLSLETASDVETKNMLLQIAEGASKGIINKDDRTPEDTWSSVDDEESNNDQIINKDEETEDSNDTNNYYIPETKKTGSLTTSLSRMAQKLKDRRKKKQKSIL